MIDALRPDPPCGPFSRFYHLRWNLGEIAEYAARFTTSHNGSVEDVDKWQELLLYLR